MTSSAFPYDAQATTALTHLGLRDVRLVVPAQVGDLPFVEQDHARQRRHAGARQLTGRPPRVLVVLVVEEHRELGLGSPHQLERRFGDDSQRSLVADEQVLELIPARGLADLGAAAVADADNFTIGQDDLERDHEVARVTVPGADQRPAARADPPADQRARVRSRVVGIDVAVLAQLLVELEHVEPGLDRDRAVVVVELDDPVHQLDVDEDAVPQRDGPVGQARRARARHHGDPVAVGEPHHLRDLLRAGREDDRLRDVLLPAVRRERSGHTSAVERAPSGAGEDMICTADPRELVDDAIEQCGRHLRPRIRRLRRRARRCRTPRSPGLLPVR